MNFLIQFDKSKGVLKQKASPPLWLFLIVPIGLLLVFFLAKIKTKIPDGDNEEKMARIVVGGMVGSTLAQCLERFGNYTNAIPDIFGGEEAKYHGLVLFMTDNFELSCCFDSGVLVYVSYRKRNGERFSNDEFLSILVKQSLNNWVVEPSAVESQMWNETDKLRGVYSLYRIEVYSPGGDKKKNEIFRSIDRAKIDEL